jgi:uracil-DNA glycosylase family 4
MDKKEELLKINDEIKRCKICKAFGKGKAVPGEGNPDAKIFFVGEAPGSEEAKSGRPFVGRSGRFLREVIKKLGIKEDDIYITSPLKYMPLKGKPDKRSITHGQKHLLKQLEVVNPKIIVLLGSVACYALLNKKIEVLKEHGKIIKKDDKTYLITLHPAYAMRFPEGKKKFVRDMKKLKNIL